jgi:hypothetical protein
MSLYCEVFGQEADIGALCLRYDEPVEGVAGPGKSVGPPDDLGEQGIVLDETGASMQVIENIVSLDLDPPDLEEIAQLEQSHRRNCQGLGFDQVPGERWEHLPTPFIEPYEGMGIEENQGRSCPLHSSDQSIWTSSSRPRRSIRELPADPRCCPDAQLG